jgi:hypothetical protein
MKVHWHQLSFTHSCGREGTIMEVCVSSDGGIGVGGICVICGEDFSIEDTFAKLIAQSAIRDFLKHKDEQFPDLAEFVPKGRPS